MSVHEILEKVSRYLHSPQFAALARHPNHPNAFTRRRKLPLPSLIAVMLCGMCKSVQAELDLFFAHLKQQTQLVREVSEQAFAQAREKLAYQGIQALNDYLIEQTEHAGYLLRWHGLRLVAADGTWLKFALRASEVKYPARANQIALGLFLPGSEMMLAAALHSPQEGERQMLIEQLDRLGPNDLLLLDRGDPSKWLVAVLNQHQVSFCMRVEKQGENGFACVRKFLRSGLSEQVVTLEPPSADECNAYQCPRTPQTVRLVRHVASNGKVRVLMTNLMDTQRFPAEGFGDLYHCRWRIEEAFKRLKHRLNLEHVSGLSHQAVAQDFAAKILCDNIQSLITLEASGQQSLPENHRINRAYAYTALKPLLPLLLLGQAVASMLQQAMELIASRTFKHRPGVSKPRYKRSKPHKHMTQKQC